MLNALLKNLKRKTIAVTKDNFPVTVDGKILMRPAGHGALLENLNNIDSDLVFIKNIDNVTKPELERENSVYKKLIAGVLIEKKKLDFSIVRGGR